MLRFIPTIGFLALSVFVVTPVLAQGGKAPAVELSERLTVEEAQKLALKAVPGKMIAVVKKYALEELYYGFSIGVEDGSIYEVPVHSLSGEIPGISVVSIGRRARSFPFDVVSAVDARETVKAHLIENMPGKRPPFMRDGEFVVHERKLAYEFNIKKSGHWYKVLVDGRSGDVIDVQGSAP